MKSPNSNDNPAPKPMPLTLPAQRPALSTSDLIVYLDAEGTRFIKSRAVPGMSDEALRAAHRDVQELLCQLKARRDALNKRARRKELADPRPLQKAKRRRPGGGVRAGSAAAVATGAVRSGAHSCNPAGSAVKRSNAPSTVSSSTQR